MSLPPRGAWIEIQELFLSLKKGRMSLPPRGAWIEIFSLLFYGYFHPCRSPRGERGLKFLDAAQLFPDGGSLPPRGAWIEIPPSARSYRPP